MRLSHETTLDDLVEPALRLYRRRRSYRVNRWRAMVVSAVVFGFFGLLGFRNQAGVNVPLLCAGAALWGAAIVHFTYDGLIRRSLRNHLTREFSATLPWTGEYRVDGEHLHLTARGATRTLPLADLRAVTADARWLELDFGDNNLCVIPLRAFDDEAHKHAFLSAVQETGGSEDAS